MTTSALDNPVIEIRTYKLHPGRTADLDRLVRERAVPMLTRFGLDVAGVGRSLADDDHYFLIRRFPSLGARVAQEEAFYTSAEWRETLREEVLACIDNYHTVVLPANSPALRGAWPLGR